VLCPEDASWTATPKLARNLLEVMPAHDGDLRLSATPELVGVDDVEALASALQRERRRGLAFVAGSHPGLPLQPWTDYVGKLLHQTNGLASGYVLHPNATERFAELMGPTHAASPATVRTYEPGVVLGDRADALRHRVLGTERLGRDSHGHLAKLLGRRARELALGTPLPRDVQRLDQVLRRRLDDQLVADARPVRITSAVPAAPAALATVPSVADRRAAEQVELRSAFRELLTELTGSDQLTVDAVTALQSLTVQVQAAASTAVARDAAVDQLQARIRDLETAVDQERDGRQLVEGLYEVEQLNVAVAEEERADAQRHLRYLQQRFSAVDTDGTVWVAPAADPVEVPPDSMDDLLVRLGAGELDRVLFTGDTADAVALDGHHTFGVHARKAWEALLALQDYAAESAAGRCGRDVDGYLKHTPPECHGYSANRHAATESEDVQTNKRFAAQRVRPVPVEVDASGCTAMWAHFKLAQSGTTSPRLHYYDDTTRTGKVYVGYIGAHLRTGQTN
jgi:uncharacterized coiled-coil protein SlyX